MTDTVTLKDVAEWHQHEAEKADWYATHKRDKAVRTGYKHMAEWHRQAVNTVTDAAEATKAAADALADARDIIDRKDT